MKFFVAMSGGKDSIVVAHLIEKKLGLGNFKLLWANPGFNFPHVEAHIRALASYYGMHEIKSDLKAHWDKWGIPAEVTPTHNWIDGGIGRSPKVLPWTLCCAGLLVVPMRDYLIGLNEPVTLFHGQRHEDGAPNNGPDGWQVPDRVMIESPIADWSTSDVVKYIVENELPIPAHYPEVKTSLDCWICPALFSHAHGAERLAYMKREYPGMLETVIPYLRTTNAAARAALDSVDELMARA